MRHEGKYADVGSQNRFEFTVVKGQAVVTEPTLRVEKHSSIFAVLLGKLTAISHA